jgi:ADP-ribose pyrophosphatase
MDAGSPSPPAEIIDRSTLAPGRWPLEAIRFRYRRFDGAFSDPQTWTVWRRGRAVAVVPYDPITDRVVLIEQFRLPAWLAGRDPVLLEVPAGLLESADPEACARREVAEEAGVELLRIEAVGDFLLTPGGSDETIMLFAGQVAAPQLGQGGVHGLAHEHENIRVTVFDAADAIAAAFDGRVANATTAIALAWLGLNRDRLRKEWL